MLHKARTNWLMLTCFGMILFLCIGQRHSFGLYLRPMTMDLGWDRATFSFAIALQNLVWGISQPFTGMLADRYGARRIFIVGGIFYALGLYGMSQATTGIGFASSAGLLVGIAQSCTGFGIVYGAVGKIVSAEKRGTALGIVGAFGSLGQFAMLPSNQALIGHVGWAHALLIGSGACLLMVALAFGTSAPAGKPSGAAGQSMVQALKQAFRHQGFLLLTLGFFACGFQLAFIATHLPAYLADEGLSPTVGVTALAIVALANILGTYLCGYFGEKFSKKYLLAAIYAVRGIALAAFVLAPVTPLATYIFAAVMGLIWLGTVPLSNGVVGQIFGYQHISMLYGFVFLSHQLGSFLGVWLGGVLFDLTGNYQAVWAIAIGLSAVAAIISLPIDDRAVQARPAHV
ncbi:Predicted arabinose efflux permease, MFS family [Collimonas sp. OK607]|uniref:MFS transporter n=1 Tax=Collimonas sp. OK607 TaxID=1798194 RepID=UPI0008E2A373|nr:MFS transporter [Collimonas sp. OK607]SFA85906.1 Predicted arabinose efflux permease, MFS family [Collimonas sp. OK607]